MDDGFGPPRYDLQLASRIDVGMLTALTYDTLLNIEQEYRLVWRSQWNLIKCLYLWARYSTFIDTAFSVYLRTWLPINPTTCHMMTGFMRIFAVMGAIITELILTIRTYALYEKLLPLLAFLSVMWLSIGGVNMWALINWTGSLTQVPLSPPTSCNLDSPTQIGIVYYVSLLIGETVIVLLTVWKGFRTFWQSRSSYRHSQLVTTVYRDGVLFYLAIFVILLVDCITAAEAREGRKYLADSPLRVMQSILACHFVLHARAVADKDISLLTIQ
ncbi:hypothetical protein B0H19DRAFT_1272659 [Mycena capillaripes]|nr:hypothetical protein B0H19DRAFT_1272659 [Mycena capillaripes]